MENLRIKLPKNAVESLLKTKLRTPVPKNEEIFLFKSGAKLYSTGRGSWLISGYSYDGKDVGDAVKQLFPFLEKLRR